MIPARAGAARSSKNAAEQTSERWFVNNDMQGPYQPYSILRTPYLYQIVSGVLLVLAFPFAGWGFLAWIAFIPLLAAVHHAQNRSQAFGFGLITGVIFYGGSMHWMTHVTTVGWLLLCLMEAMYLGGFALLAYFGMKSQKPVYFKILWVALAWIVVEFLRTEMPVVGFGWNSLA